MTIQPLQQNNKRKRNATRVDKLAVLPVFFKLEGKRAVLAGGSDAAAWKGELLAASGAQVHVYAEEFDDAFDLLKDGEFGSNFTFHQRPWASDILEHADIAIADAETMGEAQAFYCAARAKGVPVNVIDKPKFCEFQFGSIVNRSPAIVSISTDGAAPILGQAIRRKIETLLPDYVASWAQLAAKMRALVNDKLDFGKERRLFWERFVDRAFQAAPNEAVEQDIRSDIDQVLSSNSNPDVTKIGQVTLVGAGPGDAELLTIKAVRALQSADVILFDDLVSDDVLELARREAKRMLVGKRGGRESCKQEDINDMMVNFAKSGKRIVRLKSGDPMVFGRAGEEMAELKRQNIPFSIVPGITAASAMASTLGASLTHRDHAQSVRLVTGHSKKGALPKDVNWKAIADPTTTTIFYMGGRTAPEIKEQLVSHGLTPSTPVVIMSSITRKNQSYWKGDLNSLPDGVAEIGYHNPVLIGVGSVFEKCDMHEVVTSSDIEELKRAEAKIAI